MSFSKSAVSAFVGSFGHRGFVPIVQDEVAFLVQGDVSSPIRFLGKHVHHFNPVPWDQTNGDMPLANALKTRLPLAVVDSAAMQLKIMLCFPQRLSHGEMVVCALVWLDAPNL